MKAVGLSIEGSKVRASIVSGFMGMVSPVKMEEFTLPEKEEERSALLRDELSRWANEQGVKGVVIGVDFREFSHHILELPLKTRIDVSRALAFEMEKYLPLPPEEYVFDFHIIESKKEGTRSIVFALRKTRIEWIIQCIMDAGLKLLGVKCSFMEAVGEFISMEKKSDVIFFSPSEGSYSVAGITRSAPIYLRSVVAKEFLKEIDYLRDIFGEGIYTTGSGDKVPPEITAKTLPYSLPHLVASSAFKKRGLRLDFTPEEFAEKKMDLYSFFTVFFIIVSIILYISTGVVSYRKDKEAIDDVEYRLNRIKSTAGGLIETRKELEAIEKKREFLHGFRQGANGGIRALRILSSAIPKDAYLTDCTSDETGRVEIKGYAKRASDIIEPIEKTKFFRKVEFSAPTTRKDDLQRFSLKMEISQ